MPPKLVRGYGLAVLAAASSLALTRFGWRMFAPTPYAPAFAAVAIATHWGSPGAGLLAIALAVAGAFLTFPPSGAYPWQPYTVVLFVAAALIGNRLISARNRTAAALRASEAQLRVALDDMRDSGEKLRRAQRAEALGQLAARVAHSFNNLLTVTMVYADVLDEHPEEKLRRQALEEIRKASARGAALTRQLLAFGRKHDPQLARVHVDRAVEALREMLRRLVREDVTLTFDLGWESAPVMMDPHDLEQVVLNLVMNARDAVAASGEIHLSVGRASLATGEYVCLCVRDNGMGMSPQTQAHLFEPFFTTKGHSHGSGVGLAYVSEIAQHAGGYVTVDSAPGEGTTVSVYFAVAPPDVDAPNEDAADVIAVPGKASMILLVEDEDSVRETTAWLLRRAGHRVLPAASPIEAIALFRMYMRDIDLLITDIVLPEMSGSALATELLWTRAELAVLFISAYPDARPPRQTAARPIGFLAKPFTGTQLLSAIAELNSHPS